jgi:putative transposase
VRQTPPLARIYTIFLVEPEPLGKALEQPKNAVGVDLGLTRLVTLSDGRFLENPRPLERSLEKISIIHKKLSRKKFLSKNWLKTKTCEGTRTLKGFQARLFKLGTLLSQEYDVLVLEDLNVESLIQKSETKKRRLRLYNSAFSELRGCLECF